MYPDEKITSLAIASLTHSFFRVSLEIDLFKILGNEKLSLSDLSHRLQLPKSSTRVIVQHMTNSHLLNYASGKISNSNLGKDFLVDDIDICYRSWQSGWEVWYVSTAIIIHHHQAKSDNNLFSKETLIHMQSMGHFMRKNWKRLLFNKDFYRI